MRSRVVPVVVVIALAIVACSDQSPTLTPAEPPADSPDVLAAAAVSITLSPPLAHLAKKSRGRFSTIQFTAVVRRGSDTLDVDADSIDWSVTDTAVVKVDSVGRVTARGGGYALLIAKWKYAISAAALLVEDLAVTIRSNYMNQGVGGAYRHIAGRPVFVHSIVTADTANTWTPVAEVTEGPWWNVRGTYPMEVPDSGLPVGIKWNDYQFLDSAFRAIIPADSVQAGRPFGLAVGWDWNVRDGEGPWNLGADVVSPPKFHLTIVPVLWDSIPDRRILDWTKGLTADSFRIITVREQLPVRFDYPVTVKKAFTTKHDLTTYSGWRSFLVQLDSIRLADWQKDSIRSYYYGAVIPPAGSPIGGRGYIGYPASVGALWALTHELGHNMSLYHAPCGGPRDVDPDFPYEDGRPRHWGYSFWNRVTKDPKKFHDVMSYCNPPLMSDYHFNKALKYRLEKEDQWWEDDDAYRELPPVVTDPPFPPPPDWIGR